MTPLDRAQAWLVGAIVEPGPAESGAAQWFTPGPRMTPGERLGVYRDGYLGRLVECLADDYPVLAEALGEEAFRHLCEGYVARHPSTGPNLNAFGRHLSAHAPEAGLPAFLAELATLEWSLVEMIHAAPSQGLDPATLAQIRPEEWPEVRFAASEAARLHRFTHPVNAYYRACREGQRPEAFPEPRAAATLVYRQDLTVWRMDLAPAAADVLEALLAGKPLGDALARAGEGAEADVQGWFREWMTAGLFCGVKRGG